MNPMKKFVVTVFVFAVSTGFLPAKEGSFISKVIHESDQPLRIELSKRQFIKISNFTQARNDPALEITAIGTVAVFQGAASLAGINVLTAAAPSTTHNPHEDVFIGGPAIVYIGPVTGSTLFITYLRGSD